MDDSEHIAYIDRFFTVWRHLIDTDGLCGWSEEFWIIAEATELLSRERQQSFTDPSRWANVVNLLDVSFRCIGAMSMKSVRQHEGALFLLLAMCRYFGDMNRSLDLRQKMKEALLNEERCMDQFNSR